MVFSKKLENLKISYFNTLLKSFQQQKTIWWSGFATLLLTPIGNVCSTIPCFSVVVNVRRKLFFFLLPPAANFMTGSMFFSSTVRNGLYNYFGHHAPSELVAGHCRKHLRNIQSSLSSSYPLMFMCIIKL